MEDVENFKKRINSSIEKAYGGALALLPFLDEAQIEIVKEEVKKTGYLECYFDGKIIDSDRKRGIIAGFEPSLDDFKTVIYKINYNKKFYEINHRAILGSLMSLGIKRECIGDIVIDQEMNAYFACTSEIAKYIKEEFKSVGKASVDISEVAYPVTNVINYKVTEEIVSSLRLDVIICAAYNFSRQEALDELAGGLVLVNHFENKNPSYLVKENDEITVRHKGRFALRHIGGATRSGRIIVTIAKRI